MKRILLIAAILAAMLLSACGAPVTTPTPTPTPVPPPSGATLESILGVHTTKAVGEQKVIVIIADFPDVKPTLSKEDIYNKVFVDLDEYFRDASYGQMWLKGNITKRYLLPQPVSRYKVSPYNLSVDRTVVQSLVQSVLDAADSDVNFSQYSHVMIVLGASFNIAPWGCLIPGLLGTSTISTKSGQTISSAAMLCEDSHLGSFAHDTIHMLGGVIGGSRVMPCLYDTDLQSTPGDFRLGNTFPMIHMGFWDPLSCHLYKPELPPTGLSSWTKMRLGWIEPSKIAMVSSGQTATVTLDPLDSASSSTQVIKIPLTSDTFYLVENRQKVGFDEYCPSSGILILYADDTYKGECRHGQGPVQLMDANPSVPYLQGAVFNIGKKEIFVDTQNNLAIILLRKVGLSYEIKITTADKADIASGSCVFPTFPEGFQGTK
jgi:M6 family metalloprotease-like protein